jgi:hypothetical protein
MRHFNISYTAAFNQRHGRPGHLYQGRFGVQVEQFSGISPLRKRKNFIKYETVPGYMGKNDRKGRPPYRKFIKWGMDKDVVNTLELGKGLGIVGEEGFVQWSRKNSVEADS